MKTIFEFKILPINKLFIDQKYQRPIQNNIQSIADNFNPYAAQAICVAKRDNGSLYVVDGQQRCKAASMAGYTHLPCLIFKSSGSRQEAAIFAKLNGVARKSVTPMQNFIALYESGDPSTMKIVDIIGNLGFSINYDQNRNNRKWPMISSIRSLERIYQQSGPTGLEMTLSYISRIWQYDADALQESFILGFWMFLSVMNRNSFKRLAEQLKRKTPKEYIKAAQQSGFGYARYKLIKDELMRQYGE